MSKETILKQFEEKFIPKDIKKLYIEPELGKLPIPVIPNEMKEFILSALTQIEKETTDRVVDWCETRCEDNMKLHGTAKWNVDLEELITKLKQ